jgi:hypothetical protein
VIWSGIATHDGGVAEQRYAGEFKERVATSEAPSATLTGLGDPLMRTLATIPHGSVKTWEIIWLPKE